jgi:glycosyltransferase involved in cell wall biosynthesis
MRISICIPQYNRIAFLLKGLALIEQQTYPDIEVIVSDDCSTDDTEQKITALIPVYKFPLVYKRNDKNLGYDRNFRQSIEMASGQYIITIGNDDTINPAYDVALLADFLKANNYPDLGFCNFLEESSGNTLVERAHATAPLGSGYKIAMNYYSCFSFVGGLVYKRDAFLKYNTGKHDGSIFAQIYMGCLMIAKGCTLFSVREPVVIKDIVLEETQRNSYKDTLARKWADYKAVDGGLPSVVNVLIDAFRDAGVLSQTLIYSIFKRIYTITFPYWIVDYKGNGAFPEAVGLVRGLYPARNENFRLLKFWNGRKIYFYYVLFGTGGMLMPSWVFNKLKNGLYKKIKKVNA